ncbi:Hypothetical Protein RradSPS_0989 [Rubrobacter radiotolerans]|uniref:Uncharacterized protein n=2 Tax=Rubrobacter radiotolerans TaxID=42256 RepID=A0A023X1C2_RUBRA|nr:Hypothetical Protein RradSPS_0989 [Rubrobacter radiotolerans]
MREPEMPDGAPGSEEREGLAAGEETLVDELAEFRSRLGARENTIRELHASLAEARLAADDERAARRAGEERLEVLKREHAALRERSDALERELGSRRRSRESQSREAETLRRENDRLSGEVSRREHLIRMAEEEVEELKSRYEALVVRKESALEDALRRIAGLERDLEEREVRILELEADLEERRLELERERTERMKLAEPENRLRAGIELFNESRHREAVTTLSRTLGQPNVHVELGRGEEPPVFIGFTWRGVSWRTFAANPGLAVEEPRIYVVSSGEDLSGVDEKPPNAHVGPGGRVLLGL